MLRFVTKSDIWAVENRAAQDFLQPQPKWQLKNIQDAVAMELLAGVSGQTVGEVGGGRSRVLPELVKQGNHCFNIDRFDGNPITGLGPNGVPDMSGVTPIIGLVGDPLAWPPGQFDILFSISVLEHVSAHKLGPFFEDCRRLLKIGGRLLHLIDVYAGDSPDEYVERCMAGYREPFTSWLEPAGAVMTEPVTFRCAWASNPDPAMKWWNEIAPALTAKRAVAQSCSLVMDGRRKA